MRAAIAQFSLAGVALSALFLACSEDRPPAPLSVDEVVDAGPDIASTPEAAARPILPYPAGPYGTGMGEVMPDLRMVGYALSRTETDSSKLPFREITLAEVRSDPACSCLVVALTANGTQCIGSIHHDRTLTALLARKPSLCAMEISYFNHDGIGAELRPETQPPTRADIDAFTQAGRENFPVGIPLRESREALGAFAIGVVPASFIVRPSDMRILSLQFGSGDSFEYTLDRVCKTADPGIENLAGELWPRRIAVDGSHVYVADAQHGILRLPLAGGALETVTKTSAPPDALLVDDGHVYWATREGTTNVIARIAKSGGGAEVLASGPSGFASIARAGDRVFFARADGVIGGVPITGGDVFTIAAGEATPSELVADQTHVYWIAHATGEIARASIAGGARETVVAAGTMTGAHPPRLLAWLNDGLIASTSWDFYRVPKTGGAPTAMNSGGPREVQAFVAPPGGGALLYGTVDPIDRRGVVGKYTPQPMGRTGGALPLTSGQARVASVATDGAHAYWISVAEDGSGVLRRQRIYR